MNLRSGIATLDAPFDTARIRQDFPIFDQLVHGKPLVFLDSAASSQKPVQVLDAMDQVYRTTYANVHRGVYAFSERSTELYDLARERIARFIRAPSAEQVEYLETLGMDAVRTHERELTAYALERLRDVPGLHIVGPTRTSALASCRSRSMAFTRMTWRRCSTAMESRST